MSAMVPKLIIFTGPMFAGKTSHLLKCWENESMPKYAFKYSNDKRYETVDTDIDRQIISHNDMKLNAIGITCCMEINNYIPSDATQVSIFLDEGQFFKDIKLWLSDYVSKHVKIIYISGLDYDIFGHKFNTEFSDICDLADECHTLTANCYICNEPANYTQFIDNNSLANINDNILIGGSEQYQPACINHFKPPAKG